MGKVSASELEQQIFELEGIRTIIRGKRSTEFNAYDYKNKAAASTSITEWKNTRLIPILGDTEVEIIDGSGQNPHGRTSIEKVRNSYMKK